MTVVRLLVLSACVAAGWLALSLAVSAPAASAATTTAGWGYGDSDDHEDTGLRGILSTVKTVVDPVADPIADTVSDTVADTVEPVAKTATAAVTSAAKSATKTVTEALENTLEATTELTEGVVDTVTENVVDTVVGAVVDALPMLPGTAIDLVEGLLDDAEQTLPPSLTAAAHHALIGDAPGDIAAAAHQLTAALWPLHNDSTPWSPREFILLGAGALTASGPTGPAGVSACDMPFTDRWLTTALGANDRSASDRAPASPTFDTDCTPD